MESGLPLARVGVRAVRGLDEGSEDLPATRTGGGSHRAKRGDDRLALWQSSAEQREELVDHRCGIVVVDLPRVGYALQREDTIKRFGGAHDLPYHARAVPDAAAAPQLHDLPPCCRITAIALQQAIRFIGQLASSEVFLQDEVTEDVAAPAP